MWNYDVCSLEAMHVNADLLGCSCRRGDKTFSISENEAPMSTACVDQSCCFQSATKVIMLASEVDKESGRRTRYRMELPLIEGNYTGTGDLTTALLMA